MNRSGLEGILFNEFGGNSIDFCQLNKLDRLSVQHAVECMTSYLKAITVAHYKNVKYKSDKKIADEATLAELEREDSEEKNASAEAIILKNATDLPTTPQELVDLITRTLKQLEAAKAKEAKKQAEKAK